MVKHKIDDAGCKRTSTRIRTLEKAKAEIQRKVGYFCHCGAHLKSKASYQHHLQTAKVHQKREYSVW